MLKLGFVIEGLLTNLWATIQKSFDASNVEQ